MKKIQNVTIVGSGTQGSMLAFRSAVYGRNVCIYDVNSDALNTALKKIRGWFDEYVENGIVGREFADEAFSGLTTTMDVNEAFCNADLAIENVPEILSLKQKVWADIDKAAPADMLLTTNSSSLKSSDIAKGVKRKEKTFNVNFMTPTKDDLVEVMWNACTSDETKKLAMDFLKAQKNVPIVTQKEIKGFSLNRVWRAMKKECLKLWSEGYISPEDFDRAFVLEWNTEYGPFALMDKVGLDIVRQIELTYYDESGDPSDIPPKALDELIEKGWLGEKTGKGFYEYPDPAYRDPKWLRGV